ncbi:cupin domain-containing protein [Roseomonas sp. KE2513]|nr:cupin domain-containing protein [Roseomonas sp. KE2513]
MDLRNPSLEAAAVIAALGLLPHPEGGHYRETWRDTPPSGGRGVGTAILFLLAAGERSHWHRVDAAEGWHWQAGAPLLLQISESGAPIPHRLGPDLGAGEGLFATVPAGAWQAAESLGAWSLVACTVSPAFTFEGFEIAPHGWEPG